MVNIRNNNITTPYEQYIGERVAPPTVSPDYSNSTPTDTNGISSPKVDNIYDVHLSYITQKLNEQENSLKELNKEVGQIKENYASLKSSTSCQLNWHWFLITVLFGAVIHYFIMVSPQISELQNNINLIQKDINYYMDKK